jgi:MFS family permease
VKSVYPRGSFNAHWFSLFNAVSFQIMMGAPIIVYAKSLGASSTVLGIIAAFTPLMTVFQLPAAQHLEHYGYRQFVLAGWGARSVLIFVTAAIPLVTIWDNATKLAALLTLLFFYNLLRGISSAAFMPWFAHIIPEYVRGRFLSVDQLFMYAGCLVSLLVSALVVTGPVEPWAFTLVFLISAAAASISLGFINRVPDAVAEEAKRRSSQNVPWREILGFPPFRELLIFNVIFATVLGSLSVFTVEFLREFSNLSVGSVLYLSAFAFVGSLVVLPFCGSVVDAIGSKPLLGGAIVMFALVISAWILIAAKVIPYSLSLIATINFLAGAASASFNLANVRITMATMPEMGRDHFFALFTVITSLGLGGAPVTWGIILDTIGSYEAVTGVFHWKRHSIYFLGLIALNAIAFAYIPRLHEFRGIRSGAAASLTYSRSRH